MHGAADSLNVSATAAVLFYEAPSGKASIRKWRVLELLQPFGGCHAYDFPRALGLPSGRVTDGPGTCIANAD